MKHHVNMLLLVGISLSITTTTLADSCLSIDAPTIKCFSRRSDSRHAYLHTIGTTDKIPHINGETFYSQLQITFGYRGSFRPSRIAECFFGGHLTRDDCCDERTIKIQGSSIADRDDRAWLAEYFYLPRNYNGSFTIEPRIKTFYANFDYHLGLDNCLCGLYFRVHGPVAHSRWDLNFCDNPNTAGTPENHPHGYFSPAEYEGTLLVQSFGDYAKGGIPSPSSNVAGLAAAVSLGNGEGIQNSTTMFQALKFAKISKCSRKETGVADLRFELGWKCWQTDCYHLGFNVEAAAPTGNKKDPCHLFDAVVGNGNHAEFGAGLTAHYRLWSSECDARHFIFNFEAHLTHLFKKRMTRTFDLVNKPNSAYMLAAKFGDGTDTSPDDRIGTGAVSTIVATQFAGEYAPVANLSTVSVDVSVGVQADIVGQFTYRCDGFRWDMGYNFWGRSCEDIKCPEAKCENTTNLCASSQQNTWALKGDARMFGYENNAIDQPARPLSATQSGATILSGTNNSPLDTVGAAALIATDNNQNIDTKALALIFPGVDNLFSIPSAAGVAINTSTAPVFLQCSDIELTRTRGLSHTLFSNISYTWDCECWVPFLGAGASAEFASSRSSCPKNENSSCPPCVDCGISQWSIWVMGGITFN